MKFYRIKKEHGGHHFITPYSRLVLCKNELFTIAEMKKFGIPFDYTTEVEANKNSTEFVRCGRMHRYLPEDLPKIYR